MEEFPVMCVMSMPATGMNLWTMCNVAVVDSV